MESKPQYEYKIFSCGPQVKSMDWSAAERQLNGLIADGWDIVSATTTPWGALTLASGVVQPLATFILRRPRLS